MAEIAIEKKTAQTIFSSEAYPQTHDIRNGISTDTENVILKYIFICRKQRIIRLCSYKQK